MSDAQTQPPAIFSAQTRFIINTITILTIKKQSALKPLLKKDWFTQDGNAYCVYDYFFAEWLQKEY